MSGPRRVGLVAAGAWGIFALVVGIVERDPSLLLLGGGFGAVLAYAVAWTIREGLEPPPKNGGLAAILALVLAPLGLFYLGWRHASGSFDNPQSVLAVYWFLPPLAFGYYALRRARRINVRFRRARHGSPSPS